MSYDYIVSKLMEKDMQSAMTTMSALIHSHTVSHTSSQYPTEKNIFELPYSTMQSSGYPIYYGYQGVTSSYGTQYTGNSYGIPQSASSCAFHQNTLSGSQVGGFY